MELGLGIDHRLKLSEQDHAALAVEAAALGYTSIWTPAVASSAPFERCRGWSAASGLTSGIAVLPLPSWRPEDLEAQARATRTANRGRFILGIGSGAARRGAPTLVRDAIARLRSA